MISGLPFIDWVLYFCLSFTCETTKQSWKVDQVTASSDWSVAGAAPQRQPTDGAADEAISCGISMRISRASSGHRTTVASRLASVDT